MDRRDRVRVYIAGLRDKRRAAGLCPRCGGEVRQGYKHCFGCRLVRSIERSNRRGGYTLDNQPSTSAV